jgi:nitrite reductase/ring-hydroxylating ferredoxin subunit
MSESKENPPPSSDPPQQLTGFMTNDEWSLLLAEADARLLDMEELPYPNVKEQVFALLATIDTIHREALRRLVRLFKEGVLEKVVTDPAIHTLMELYDLLPPEEKPFDEQRAKIIFTTTRSKRSSIPDPPKPKYPHWVPVSPSMAEVPVGGAVECQAGDRSIVLCRTADVVFALDARCLKDGASLGGGAVTRFNLTCPHHAGCYYDIRDGSHIAGAGRLECFCVKQNEGGRILVGVDMEFVPRRPAF